MKQTIRGSRAAFTLIELLVVIAIIAVMAAILFPVLAMAREKGRQTVCVNNFKQINLGLLQYIQDYDESMIPANTNDYAIGCLGCGRPDYIWPELVQPYIKNWQVFRCPSDTHATDAELSVGPYGGPPLLPSDPNYYYAWGSRTDVALNYVFLSPWVYDASRQFWGSQPTPNAAISSPANTMMSIDSIWDRDANGVPIGGGNWVVEAPCIKDANNQPITPTNFQGYNSGWQPNTTSWLQYGGAWPRHFGRFNISYCDGHVKTISKEQLGAGCDVQPNHGGNVTDRDAYIWDLQ